MNLSALLRSEECTKFLRLCELPEADFSGFASDFERFLALSKGLPLAVGYPFADRFSEAFFARFGRDLNEDFAAEAWKIAADGFWKEADGSGVGSFGSPKSSAPRKSTFSNPIRVTEILKKAPQSIFDLNRLVRGETAAADAVSASLASDFVLEKPNPFSVERALKNGEKSALISVQILRQICVENLCPILLSIPPSVDCRPLLEYLRKCGQKSEIFCVSDGLQVQKEIASYRSGRIDRLIHNAVRTDSALSAEELAKVCPIGAVYSL